MYLDESAPADWTSSQVDSAINYSYHELVTAVIDSFEDFYVTTTTLNSVANQQEYGSSDGLPTDIVKVRRVEINSDPSNSDASPDRALPVNFDGVYRDLGNTNLGVRSSPVYYLIGNGSDTKIGFLPIPDESGTDNIKIWYIPEQDDMSSGTDSPNIPYIDRYSKLIVWGAVADLLSKGQQEETASNKYGNKFELGLRKMKAELEERKADDSDGVTDTVGLDLNFGDEYGTAI